MKNNFFNGTLVGAEPQDPSSDHSLSMAVYRGVMDDELRRPLVEIERKLSRQLGVGRRRIRQLIRSLVERGMLTYTQELGASGVGPSFHHPTFLARNTVLLPTHQPVPQVGNHIHIKLQSGTAFGDGRHPTTRIALQLLEDHIRKKEGPPTDPAALRGIDMGTGSGILAIALAKWHAMPVTAIDTDTCAVAEAAANVRLNGLHHLIDVSNASIETMKGPFTVLLANLRFPTLHRMLPHLAAITAPNGRGIFSGLLVEEIDTLVLESKDRGLDTLSVIREGRWAGAAFRRR